MGPMQALCLCLFLPPMVFVILREGPDENQRRSPISQPLWFNHRRRQARRKSKRLRLHEPIAESYIKFRNKCRYSQMCHRYTCHVFPRTSIFIWSSRRWIFCQSQIPNISRHVSLLRKTPRRVPREDEIRRCQLVNCWSSVVRILIWFTVNADFVALPGKREKLKWLEMILILSYETNVCIHVRNK